MGTTVENRQPERESTPLRQKQTIAHSDGTSKETQPEEAAELP